MIDKQLDGVFRETLLLFGRIWLFALLLFPLLYFLRHGGVVEPLPFFLLNVLNALLLVIYLSINAVEERLGYKYMPLAVMIATVLPLVFFYLAIVLDSSHRMIDSVQSQFSVFPMQFIVLLLVALSYRLRVVNAIIVFLTFLNIFFYAVFPLGTRDWLKFLVGNLIRIITVMTASYLINRIASFLKERSKELQKANERLEQLALTRQHLAETRERNRLARELHDTLAHTLSGLTVQLEAVKAYSTRDTKQAHNLLEKAIQTSRNGLNETRRALKALRAAPLEDLGFVMAIRELAETYRERGNFELILELPEDEVILSEIEEQTVYRISQEALENVLKHAAASSVKLRLTFDTNKLVLTLEDNGKGFELQLTDKENHYGLTGMEERARMIHADFEIKSNVGQGTTISLSKEIGNENPTL